MKLLLVQPSGLMYTEVYLRLEPLGLERLAEACHNVQKPLADHREATRHPFALPTHKADEIDARDLYIPRPELVGAAMATRARPPRPRQQGRR